MRRRREKILFQGKWLSIKQTLYRTASGEKVEWELVERSRGETIIILLARLVPSGRYLLLKQFRAGINQPVIALPAGCVKPGDDLHRQAIAELKEETGYRGRVVEISPRLKINPAIMDCDVHVFKLEVDETDPDNAYFLQELEPAEEIEVILKSRAEIREFLIEEIRHGTSVDLACWLVFAGDLFEGDPRLLT